MMPIRCAGSIIRPLACPLLVSALLIGWLSGCATSEGSAQKSKGYYQEGIASLEYDQQKAFVSFQKAVKLDPNNKEARYGLGHILALQGKLVHAEEEFTAATKLDDSYSEAYTYLGQVLEKQERWTEAIAAFRQALTNPLYATPDLARFHLGRILAHEGNFQGAMEAFEDALVVNPPNVPPALLHLELGRAYYKLGFERRSKETLTKVTTLDKGGEYAAAAKELLTRLKP
ncbi:MAG: tetratricopeptide repeat protein [Nitrospira sp. CG24C]|jgi:Tfp pilus assembly protein PilF|nr:MAG: tetratricopeptide repeat protein [Nitrospira sp. CG24C]